MAQIKMEQDAYIRGIMRKKNDVVEVSSAEARQFISNGTASDVSDKPEKNSIHSAFAGKISVADSEGSNEWMMHVFFDTDIENMDFVIPHAAVVGQSGRKGLESLLS